jgi:putative component of membrane protein insertase Oxa1/YidC/SpoIIIJ protein YidD|tara:strand:+ start:1864 stop:2553 length:690 start_codon:yes stop_codon:yes gene_type:complete
MQSNLKIKLFERFFRLLLPFLLLASFVLAQEASPNLIVLNYPVDTLLNKNDLSRTQHFTLSLIRMWQQHSYNDPQLNCQFYPSCSNYCAINIQKNGTIPGLFISADRYIRCNNSAQNRYQIYSDGSILPEDYRISDNFIPKERVKKRSKHVVLGMTLSIIPGLGRVYYGQITDGINSFKYTTPCIISSYYLHTQNYDILSVLIGGVAMIFWGSEFYGVYNLSKIYDHSN